MLALSFRFPGGRYHATPWGRHVNEADVAWPPEPWRILRALVASYWRKGASSRRSLADMTDLIDALAEAAPVYYLPEGAVHTHTRHYMPSPVRKTLVFDAFAHLPAGEAIVAAWPDLLLSGALLELTAELVAGIGYLGRAESWVECSASAEWDAERVNCAPAENVCGVSGEPVAVIAPRSAGSYRAERARLLDAADADERSRAEVGGKRPPTPRALERVREKRFGATLPERLFDALAVDTADYQRYGWNRPPAAREVVYLRAPLAPVARRVGMRRHSVSAPHRYTVARYLLAGRPQPRIEDAVRIGELLRLAALARFGWKEDPGSGRRIPLAPPEISGRGADGKPLRDAEHTHAFWLPEDANDDGSIDHVAVYVAAGFDLRIRTALDRLTRLWLPVRVGERRGDGEEGGRREWRLALEGFGTPGEFADASALFGPAHAWISLTPFLPTAHLKRSSDAGAVRRLLERGEAVTGARAEATGYPREVRRLLRRRGILDEALMGHLQVDLLPAIAVHGAPRRPLHFHRFRSRGGERTTDAHGALLRLRFPEAVVGPLALGYGCHFGLGLFGVELQGA